MQAVRANGKRIDVKIYNIIILYIPHAYSGGDGGASAIFSTIGEGGGFSREDSGSVAAGVVPRAIDPFLTGKAVRRRRRGAPVTIAGKAAAAGGR